MDARTVDALAMDREIVRVSRLLAQYVHGTLQSHLLATAYALENAELVQGGAAGVLQRARSAFEAEVAVSAGSTTLAGEIDRRASLWSGFMVVDIEVGRAKGALPPAVIADAGRVVEEALSNAHKHGDARSVSVVAERVGDSTLQIRVTDDGTGLADVRPGMGSAWLDFVAPDAWSLTPGPGGRGACVTVTVGCGVPA
jgi:signal transduction histidine kinase